MAATTNFAEMTVEQAINYCYKHKKRWFSEVDDEERIENTIEQFECIISCLESGHIVPKALPDYGFNY